MALFLMVTFFLSVSLGLTAQNQALGFNGTNQYMVIASSAALNPTQVTVECNVYLNTFANRPHLVGKGQSNSGSYWLVVETTGEVRFYFTVGAAGSWQYIGTGAWHTTTGQWHHYAATYDGVKARVYVDGTYWESNATPNGNLRSTTDPVYVGRSYANYPLNYVNGVIAEVRIWNDDRTSTEINDNLDNEISPVPASLVGYWKLNGNTDDSSVNNNDGVLVGNPAPQFVMGDPTLPVELSSFTATITSQYFVELHWVTQSETDALGYMIYRSQVNDLETAIQVSPLINATNTTTQVSYEYTDSEVTAGIWLYWLQSIDLNGNFSFHGPVLASVTSDQGGEAPPIPTSTGISTIYPNPFNPSVTIKYELKEALPVSFNIYNARGQIVQSYDLATPEAGTSHLVWDAYKLPAGIYLIRMQAGDKFYFSKAVLSK